MAAAALWITEADVAALLSLREAIAALEHALRLEAAGEAASMAKTMLPFDGGNLHALGGRLGGLVGTKTWAHTEGGTCPLLLLWNAHDGQLAAVIEAFALGNLRTGGISGLGTEWLAARDARTLAMLGSGKQALSQVAAVCAVRPIDEVRVFSPRADSRRAFVERVQAELGVRAVECSDVAAACDGAAVVTAATRASRPFLRAEHLARGAHLNAVGAIAPDREEFAQDVFARCGRVVVDSLAGVKALSSEFRQHFGPADAAGWSAVQTLSSLIAGAQPRAADADLTLFKAMGMGLCDLALGAAVLERARASGRGRALDAPRRARPRLTDRAGLAA